jgi:hypothetical protein
MNSPQVGLRVAAIVSGMISLAHLWRVLIHLEIRLGAHDLPQWVSVVAVIGAGAVCLWLWRLSTKLDRA